MLPIPQLYTETETLNSRKILLLCETLTVRTRGTRFPARVTSFSQAAARYTWTRSLSDEWPHGCWYVPVLTLPRGRDTAGLLAVQPAWPEPLY